MSNILTLGECSRIVGEVAEIDHGVVVYCHGTFDLMHYGHIRHFEDAAALGDILVVGVTGDAYMNRGPGKPVFNEEVRARSIAALECVDYVFIDMNHKALTALSTLKPDIYVKGVEYRDNPNEDLLAEIQIVEEEGGRIEYTDTNIYSSSSLINENTPIHTEAAGIFLRDLTTEYPYERLIEILDSFSNLDVIVVGDIILDRYTYVDPKERAPKTTMLSMKEGHSELMCGAVVHVANHIAKFVNSVELITSINEVDIDYVSAHLEDNVRVDYILQDAPTTLKHRYLDRVTNQKLFELCTYEDPLDTTHIDESVQLLLEEGVPDNDLLVVCDFGHGTLSQNIADYIRTLDVFTAVNVQCSGLNIGYNLVTKYGNMQYLALDEQETRLALGDKAGDIEECISKLGKLVQCDVVSMTYGARGSYVWRSLDDSMTWVPVMSSEVVDTIGAGDVYLALTTLATYIGLPSDVIGFLGNAIAALAVRSVCTQQVITPLALRRFIKTLTK